MISGFWRVDIDTCICCIETLQLCARCWKKKIKCVRVKKERKKRGSVHWMEGRPWKKKREVLALLYWFCVYQLPRQVGNGLDGF